MCLAGEHFYHTLIPMFCILQVIGPQAVELDHLVAEMTEFYRQEENRECHALHEVQ